MTLTQGFVVQPIPPDVVEQLRVVDDAGQTPTLVVDSDGGSPLRCCLTASRPGETLMLASYAPLRRWAKARNANPAAYDEQGPIFLHPEPCAGYEEDGWPTELTGPRVLRAYDGNGRIVGGELVQSENVAEQVLQQLCSNEHVAVIHARAVVFGCFTFAVEPRRSA